MVNHNSPLFHNPLTSTSGFSKSNLLNKQKIDSLCAPPAPVMEATKNGPAKLCTVDISGYSLDHFKTINFEGYTLLYQLGESLDSNVKFFPNTSKVVVNLGNSQSYPMLPFEKYIPCVAKDLNISQVEAVDKITEFFANKQVVVQPVGVQGYVYNTMRSIQNYTPMFYATEALTTFKTVGITGGKIISAYPLTFVGVTYMGSIVLGYFGAIAGDNAFGVIFNYSSFVLSRPMRGVEIVLNGIILQPLSNVIGMPLMLNGTQEILHGQGMKFEDYGKISFAFNRIVNSKVIKKIKETCKIWFHKQ